MDFYDYEEEMKDYLDTCERVNRILDKYNEMDEIIKNLERAIEMCEEANKEISKYNLWPRGWW
jgi:uncharacterized protein YdcH (DUF465 family)